MNNTNLMALGERAMDLERELRRQFLMPLGGKMVVLVPRDTLDRMATVFDAKNLLEGLGTYTVSLMGVEFRAIEEEERP